MKNAQKPNDNAKKKKQQIKKQQIIPIKNVIAWVFIKRRTGFSFALQEMDNHNFTIMRRTY